MFGPRLLNILEEKNINRGIIVFPHTMTPMARKVSTRSPYSHDLLANLLA